MSTVILDLFGVLVKENEDAFYDFVTAARPTVDRETVKARYTAAVRGMMDAEDMMKSFGFAFPKAAADDFLDRILTFDGDVYAFLRRAASENATLILGGNFIGKWGEHILERHGIRDRFAAVAASDTLHAWKPEDAFYKTLRATYSLDPAKCHVVDGDPGNIPTATHFGFPTSLFMRSGSHYGSSADFGALQVNLFGCGNTWIKRAY